MSGIKSWHAWHRITTKNTIDEQTDFTLLDLRNNLQLYDLDLINLLWIISQHNYLLKNNCFYWPNACRESIKIVRGCML